MIFIILKQNILIFEYVITHIDLEIIINKKK